MPVMAQVRPVTGPTQMTANATLLQGHGVTGDRAPIRNTLETAALTTINARMGCVWMAIVVSPTARAVVDRAMAGIPAYPMVRVVISRTTQTQRVSVRIRGQPRAVMTAIAMA